MIRDIEYDNIICNRINELRLERGLSIEALAYQSGLSKGGISEILNLKKGPCSLTIAKICSCLGITLSQFYDFKEINHYLSQL